MSLHIFEASKLVQFRPTKFEKTQKYVFIPLINVPIYKHKFCQGSSATNCGALRQNLSLSKYQEDDKLTVRCSLVNKPENQDEDAL